MNLNILETAHKLFLLYVAKTRILTFQKESTDPFYKGNSN